jgi:redox-sensitive bicupin YhaK (pirin superfamily)
MITIRPRDQRGTAKIGWLDSKHTFSFGHYYDPSQMGFRALRVINEDRVIPGAGFPTHGHRDMEIISYVLKGALAHKDSTGTAETIRPGEVQRMTAGTGVRHSEFNASDREAVHFLQIWILPEREGLEPGYEQRAFGDAEKRGRLRLVASRDGRDGSVTVHQDVALYATVLGAGDKVGYDLKRGRHAWVQVARGQVRLNGELLKEGDGAAITQLDRIELEGATESETLLFDLA